MDPKIGALWAAAKECGLRMRSVKTWGQDERRGRNEYLMDDQRSGFAEVFELWYKHPDVGAEAGDSDSDYLSYVSDDAEDSRE